MAIFLYFIYKERFYQILEDFWKIFKIGRFLAEIRSFSAFFGQKSANFENFSKLFWNLIKLTEIHVWSKLQLIWSIFGLFMAILRPNFGHFSLYIKYRKIAIFYRTYTYVCLNKSRTVDFSI